MFTDSLPFGMAEGENSSLTTGTHKSNKHQAEIAEPEITSQSIKTTEKAGSMSTPKDKYSQRKTETYSCIGRIAKEKQ